MGIRVLLVDDHGPFREIAREVLSADGFDIVGEAADGRTGIAMVAALAPEIVLLDVQLPDLDGFAVARALSNGENAPAVILVSSREARDFGDRLNGTAFITKGDLSGAALRAALACAS